MNLWAAGILLVTDRDPRRCPIDGCLVADIRIDLTTMPNPEAPPFELGTWEALSEAEGVLVPCGHSFAAVRRQGGLK